MPLEDVLKTHIERQSSIGDSIISVRRKYLWEDSVVQFLKRSFDPHKSIRVIFLGEEAADGGGPRKEYFRLLCRNIREQSGVFFYSKQLVNFRSSVSLFHERRFHLVGKMIGTSILHGGPAFPFLPKAIYGYIAHGWCAADCTVADVANPSTLQIINKVHVHACINTYTVHATM